jgi:hypothetical protein
MDLDDFQIILGTSSAVIATVSLIITAFFSWKRYQHDVMSRNVSATISLIKEWRSLEMREARIAVFKVLKPNYGGELGLDRLPPEIKNKVALITHLCDEICMRVVGGEADESLIVGFIGTRVVELWVVLKPFISTHRVEVGPSDSHAYFEAFASKYENFDFVKARAEKILIFQKIKYHI